MRSVVRRRAATERCVAAWTLSYIHGASISQIAKMLKCTPSAVAYAINRQESSVRHALFRARGEPWMIRLHVAGAIGDWDSRVLQSRAAQDVMDRT